MIYTILFFVFLALLLYLSISAELGFAEKVIEDSVKKKPETSSEEKQDS